MINENVEDANIEALLLADEQAMKFKRLLYSSEKVQANLRKMIPMYDEMGIFDCKETSKPSGEAKSLEIVR